MPDLGLCGLELAQIASGKQQAGGVIQGNGLDRHFNVEQVTPARAPQHFAVADASLFGQFLQQRPALCTVTPNPQFISAAANDFAAAVTGQPAEPVIDFKVVTGCELANGDGVRAGVERLGEFFFTGFKRRFSSLLLRNVEQCPGHAQGLTLRIAVQAGPTFEVA